MTIDQTDGLTHVSLLAAQAIERLEQLRRDHINQTIASLKQTMRYHFQHEQYLEASIVAQELLIYPLSQVDMALVRWTLAKSRDYMAAEYYYE